MAAHINQSRPHSQPDNYVTEGAGLNSTEHCYKTKHPIFFVCLPTYNNLNQKMTPKDRWKEYEKVYDYRLISVY